MKFSDADFNLSEVILLFAVLQAVFLIAVLLKVPAQNRSPNTLLSLLLACLALILLEHVWLYSGAFYTSPQWSGFSLPGLVLLSPLYYFYANSFLRKRLDKRIGLHLLPSALVLLLISPWGFLTSERKVELLQLSISSGLPFFSTHATLVATAIAVHMLVYFYATYLLVEGYERQVREGSADAGVLSIHWLTQSSFCFCLFAVLFYLSALGVLIMPSDSQGLPLMFAYAIAGFVFFLAYYAISQPDLFARFQPGKLPAVDELEAKPKYQNTVLEPALLEDYKQQLLVLMETDQPYLDGDLRIAQLADRLGIPAYQVSQVINVAFAESFFDFINRYRVGYAKMLLLRDGERSNILDVALQSGFNSKASFNRVFKRATGMTPSQFHVRAVKTAETATNQANLRR